MSKNDRNNQKGLNQKNKFPKNPEKSRKTQVPGYDERQPGHGLPPQTHQPK